MAVRSRIRSAWNAFRSQDTKPQSVGYSQTTTSSGTRPDKARHFFYNDRSIVSSIYTRIAIDFSQIDLRHVMVDEFGRYDGDAKTSLNTCLTLEPNLDQGPADFKRDLIQTLFDKGVAAIVPVDTGANPGSDKKFDIFTMRIGEVVAWKPRHVKVSVYNVDTGRREEITLEKRFVGIIENPLHAVMNEPNSTLQRLIRKLSLLDTVDEQSASGKLDMIIQLPYVVKSDARKEQAEQRRQDIEFQLKDSKYGVAYTEATEKITQLNRPVENHLDKRVEYLVNMLYGQLGITEEVMNGTADEKIMLNYMNRTIKPLLQAVVEAMRRSFISSDRESIMYFRDPFALVPLANVAEIADKFTRNEILSANEIRVGIGVTPHKDPKADKLQNSNMPVKDTEPAVDEQDESSQNGT